MLQSQLFSKTTKSTPHDEPSFNAQMLIKAGFIDKLLAGVYTMLPLGQLVMKKIEQIIREEINKINGQEIFMPALHPLENYQTTKRDKIDVLFNTELHSGPKLVLGQSHEEVIVPLLKKYILSYKDLPKSIYQFQTKFRNELRAKSGIMRGREFMMKDLYSFHATEEDLNAYYKKAQKAYFKIFERAGILDQTYLTFALGGTFSKYSHEFQTVCEAGEDIIYICDKCSIAINKELIKEQNVCPNCENKELEEKKSIEVGNIFKQKTRFSKPFDFKYTTEEGKKELVTMGAYGIGLGRLMGTIVELSHDDAGIIWPSEVAPFKAHIVSIQMNEIKVREKGKQIYEMLQKAAIDALYDDRAEARPGEKFADSDLIGCPYRIIISPKMIKKDSVEVKKRDTGDVEFIKISKLVDWIKAQ